MNEASKDIVKLLLEAGAKPILSELVHDSAVLLACKQSSPFLSYLLRYVTESELLNREDSTGKAYTKIKNKKISNCVCFKEWLHCIIAH